MTQDDTEVLDLESLNTLQRKKDSLIEKAESLSKAQAFLKKSRVDKSIFSIKPAHHLYLSYESDAFDLVVQILSGGGFLNTVTRCAETKLYAEEREYRASARVLQLQIDSFFINAGE